MATKTPSTTAFIAKILAPLSPVEQAKMEAANRYDLKKDFHAYTMAARRDMHLFEAAEYDRLYHVFHGDGKQRSSAEARFRAYESVERLILSPARSADDIKLKRTFARKVAGLEKNWPAEWSAALQDDQAFVAAKRKRV